jgi:hypothetical protein
MVNVVIPAHYPTDDAALQGPRCSLRVTVGNVLNLLAAGHTRDRILGVYPYLESADFDTALVSAKSQVVG